MKRYDETLPRPSSRAKALLAAAVGTAMILGAATVAMGQGTPTPSPGPTDPTPQSQPLSKPGTDLVINPTLDECRKGWDASMKWTKDEFERFCETMRASK